MAIRYTDEANQKSDHLHTFPRLGGPNPARLVATCCDEPGALRREAHLAHKISTEHHNRYHKNLSIKI
jgi:hypothetical protein